MKTVKFFNVCIDEAAVEAQGDSPLKNLINGMGGWNVTGKMTSLSSLNITQRIGRVSSQLFIKPFIQVMVSTDRHDSNKHILQVSMFWFHLAGDNSLSARGYFSAGKRGLQSGVAQSAVGKKTCPLGRLSTFSAVNFPFLHFYKMGLWSHGKRINAMYHIAFWKLLRYYQRNGCNTGYSLPMKRIRSQECPAHL